MKEMKKSIEKSFDGSDIKQSRQSNRKKMFNNQSFDMGKFSSVMT